ncbi:ATP-dependent acyl-CoA synthetase [Plasmodium gonderi]|uniref:ATP-dependent acyl-CoA synthetase n=1 Tax=Plasmodium gonderi TaxID=77519 RepID=A0A1Y1JAC0_PLAGO|nr:ATP-dependent acyl-CoA synthetase [Plasmodium gonderi]GAW79459.1 ATP-dependent acyl-CoA synthetase [Plasmodium gonderi]
MFVYILLFTIAFFMNALSFCGQAFRGHSYSQVREKSVQESESDVYIGRDDVGNAVTHKYTHMFPLLLEKARSFSNQVAVSEMENCKVKNKITYGELFDQVLSVSHYLNTLDGGIPIKNYDEECNKGNFKLLGIYGSNSTNWIVADLAALASDTTSLVMHSKFSIEEVCEILNESKLEWLCTDLELVDVLLERREQLPHLKKLIILDTINESTNRQNKVERPNVSEKTNEKQSNNARGVEATNSGIKKGEKETNEGKEEEKHQLYKKLMIKSKKLGLTMHKIDDFKNKKVGDNIKLNNDPEHIYTIVNTSGTSGKPKGVMLSNRSLYYTLIPVSDHSLFRFYKPGIHFSYLPLSHIYERSIVFLSLYRGMEVRIWGKDINMFAKDLCNSDANIIVGVPKVFNRLYTKIMGEIANLPPLKRFVVKTVLAMRRKNNYSGLSKFLESVTQISKKIRDKMNPSLEAFLSAGGKISPNVERDLSVLLDVNFYQGYGLTETSGPIIAQHNLDTSTNNIGGPVSNHVQYKVVTWENYEAKGKKPRGELLLKADQLFSGYFQKKDQTKSSFTDDNFYKTGDVVQINNNGSITFLDRSKGLVKLSQGEYIETEMLNNLYSDIDFMAYCVVYGDDSMDGPLAIINIDKEIFAKSLERDGILKEQNMTVEDFMKTITDEKLNQEVYVKYVREKMSEIYKKTNLNRYNDISDIYLTCKIWDTSNYLTPTLKVRRFYVFKDFDFYIQKIKKKYADKLKAK